MYISVTSLSKPYLKIPLFFHSLPFFLFSRFPRVLQWRLCSRDIDPGKCLAGELLHLRGSYFHLKQVFAAALINDLDLSYVMPYIRSGKKELQRAELSPISPWWTSSGVWLHLASSEWRYRDESWFRYSLVQGNKLHILLQHNTFHE